MSATNRGAPAMSVAITQPGHSTAKRLDVSDSVISLEFEDDEHLASKLTLTVDNRSLANFDSPIWRKGSLVQASWGYVGDMTPTYECVIQSVKGFTTLSIEALSKSILMHGVQKTRKWTAVKRSDVVKMIAAENGYSASSLHLDDSGVVLPVIYQARETDAQVLQRLARDEGFKFNVDYDGLHWHERKIGQAPLREYTWYGDPGSGDILATPNIENDVTAKPASVTISGRDPMTRETYTVNAKNENTPRKALAEDMDVIDHESGATTFQPASGQDTIAPSSDLNAAAAQRRAAGVYKNSIMTTVKLTLPVVGDPRVRAKSVVKVNGIRSLSGNYYVAKAHDSVSSAGFVQQLSLRRDGRSEIFPKAAATAGSLNTKAPNTDANKLEPIDMIDHASGETVTGWQDTKGREQS